MSGATVAETIRALSASVVAHVGAGLRDDATLFLVEYTNSDPVNRHSIPTADEHAKRDSPNSTWSSESR